MKTIIKIMKKRIYTLGSLFLLGLASMQASATAITYELDSLGGNSYQYTYTFVNDTLGVDVDWFSIYFDPDLYQNLAVTGQPAGWIADAVQPEPLLPVPDDGVFDTFTDFFEPDYAPIGAGSSLGGFSISFDWIVVAGGPSGPGAQSFDVYDEFFDVIASGSTTAIPAPSAALLLLIMAVGAIRSSRSKV